MRIFYSPDPVETPAAPAEPVSIAAQMATTGRMSNSNTPAPEPVAKPEPAATPSPEPPPVPAEPATQPAAPKVDTPPAQPSQPQAQAPTLTEFLKSHKPDTILKELGYDDKVIGFISDAKGIDDKMLSFLNDWKSGVDLKPRLEALTTDFSKMSAEDVMKYQLRQQNPELSGSDFERLFQRRVLDRYKIDAALYTEQEVADGRVDLSIDSKPVREALTTWQQSILLPKAPEPQAAVANPQASQAKQVEAFRTQLSSAPVVQNLLQTKILPIGEGADVFNMGVTEPSQIIDILASPEAWAANFYDKVVQPNGEVTHQLNNQKLLLTGAFAKDPIGFINTLGKHFKQLGAQAVNAVIENASPPVANGTTPEGQPKTPGEAMARAGKFAKQ
jgi:hypothetical protein